MMPWFMWNGTDSRSKGLYVSALPPITRAQERIEEIQVPGRPGILTLKEGEGVFEPVTLQCNVWARTENVVGLKSWLRGIGEVIFSNDPERVHYAKIYGEVVFSKAFNGVVQATIPFVCDPLCGQYPPESQMSWDGDTDYLGIPNIFNPGDVPAKPIIIATFDGSPANLSFATDGVEDVVLAFATLTDNSYNNTTFVFDSDSMVVYDYTSGEDYTYMLYKGDPRKLWIPTGGGHHVKWSPNVLSAMSIVPRWRWL